MLRSTWLLILGAGLAPACTIPASQSLGQGESSSSSSDDATTDPSSCAPNPSFQCTSPYPGTFGECGGFDFDESCCMRPTCGSAADCEGDEVCAAVGSPGLSCSEQDGACVCGADPGPFPRAVCLPADQVPSDWCGGHVDETACNAAAPEDAPQFCRWIELYTMTIDGDSCTVSELEGRCLTIDYNPAQGCGPEPCATANHDVLLTTAIARSIDDTSFEVFGLTDIFCGEGTPVGDWIPASDASLGACALTCGFDNPCAMPFEDWVGLRADATEDAPGVDCGNVTLEDPLADWQAAHDCAMQQAASGTGFRVLAQAQSIDTIVRYAFVGLQAESYAVVGLHSDESFLEYALFEEVGDGLSDVGGCTVAVGELCLATANAGPTEQLCPQ